MKNNYHKAYVNRDECVEIKQEGLNLEDVVETEITPEGAVEKTVADVIVDAEVGKVEKPEKKDKITKPFMVEIIGNLNLNVRKKPMGEIFTSLAPGAQAKVLDISEDDKWYQIESPNGFIMKEFTKKVK